MKSGFKLLKKHVDDRGLLTEILRDDEIAENIKQVYFSISKPDSIRGNHYHERKVEWFSVVEGKGKIVLENKKGELEEIILSGKTPSIVKINPKNSHAIQNIGTEDMYLIVVANEVFNPADADTFYKELI
jgi:UDP-2-acetamido-2,6-beta-L-arabino-hexul-4-ose reductase